MVSPANLKRAAYRELFARRGENPTFTNGGQQAQVRIFRHVIVDDQRGMRQILENLAHALCTILR